jgi:hypothetical protein
MTKNNKDQRPPTGETDARAENGTTQTDETQMPEIDFATFVISLNSSALVQLGILEEPGTGQKTRNLALAKQTIDVLAMLEEKTAGNLNRDEENILKSILYDLRMLYVKEKA